MKLYTPFVAALLAGVAPAQTFGSVFTLDNETGGNAVRVSLRLGSYLIPFGSYDTGGDGSGAGLGSQGALAIQDNGRRLFAVNPGSNQLTMFRVIGGAFLWRTDTVATGGDRPTSVAVHRRLVYVLNADSDTVRGFRRFGNKLHAIPGADYDLSQSGAAAAQVGFSPDGNHLVVTERATDTITVFRVLPDGRLTVPVHNASAGQTPFGFEFRADGTLVVSEAFGGAPGASTVSTYTIDAAGTLQVVTGAAATNQAAACWIAIPRGGQFAYTTNTADGTLSGFQVGQAGNLTLLDPSGVTGDLGSSARPLDADFSDNGRYLFVLDGGNDEIRGFYRDPTGGLHLLPASVATPDGAAGMIVR